MVAVDGKDWYGNVDIGILVVDVVKCSRAQLATNN